MTVTLRLIGSLSCLVCLATCLPVPSEDLKQKTLERENEVALLENGDDVLRSAALDVAALKLEDLYEQEVINTALDILKKERKHPDKALDDLQELGKTVRRDKRKVELLTAALGASSGALSAGASGSSGSAGVQGSGDGESGDGGGGGGGGGGVSAGASVGGSVGGDQLFTSKDPISLVGDKIQLGLRVKFAFLTKILQSITGVLASSTQAQSEKNGMLVYPPPKKGLF
ncbi:unnamed protein product [Bemisia tabaci]|uniref:Uncharacterized protein n=1 Tax=Bemisia tabaci TaxID=7038 RepID=A0A9P0F125_BEMTA|nr:unnamed protein product [Bemisia tabaci]